VEVARADLCEVAKKENDLVELFWIAADEALVANILNMVGLDGLIYVVDSKDIMYCRRRWWQ